MQHQKKSQKKGKILARFGSLPMHISACGNWAGRDRRWGHIQAVGEWRCNVGFKHKCPMSARLFISITMMIIRLMKIPLGSCQSGGRGS